MQLDLAPVIFHQGRQAASDSEIEAGARVGRIGRPEIVAFDVGHHLERELVMIAQEQRPLAVGRNVRRLPENVGDRKAVLLGDRHVDSRHQRKVIGHVAFVAVAEIRADVLRPLIGLGEKELAGCIRIERGPHLLDDRVGLREILVVGSFALAQIWNGVQAEPVDAEIEPAPHDGDHGQEHPRIVVVEIRLVRKEAVPVIARRRRIPGPVRFFGIVEDDPCFCEAMVAVAPHIPIAGIRCRSAPARALEPGMLVRGVIDDELGDHPQLSTLRLLHEAAKVLHGAEIGIDVAVVRNVVAVVAAGGGIERQQPERRDAEILQIVELFGQPREIADSVAVAVGKGLDVQLVDDGVLEPELVVIELGFGLDLGSDVHGTTFTQSSERAARGPASDRCASGRRPTPASAVRR